MVAVGTALYVAGDDGIRGVELHKLDPAAGAPVQPVTLRAPADAYVRDGSYAGTNFGGSAELVAKKSTNAGNSREVYIKFDTTGAAGGGHGSARAAR